MGVINRRDVNIFDLKLGQRSHFYANEFELVDCWFIRYCVTFNSTTWIYLALLHVYTTRFYYVPLRKSTNIFFHYASQVYILRSITEDYKNEVVGFQNQINCY